MAEFQYHCLQGLGAAAEVPVEHNGVEEFISFGSEPAEDEQRAGLPDAEGDRPTTSGRVETPWKGGSRRILSPLIRLHNELVDFCSFLSPTQDEKRIREAALNTISDAVTSVWTEATVQPFGSFVTGLYLPTSDLDLVILDSGCTDIVSGLRALANCLVRKGLAKAIQIIGKAKVPIIKFQEIVSGLNFDVSFNAANGPQAAEYVRDLMQQLPPMRSLILILKVFLHQRELNEVYMGGIGSYALLVMVAAFLLLHPSRDRDRELEGNLGVLLLDFFRLYGRALNATDVGVSCRKGGSFFYKRDRGFQQLERPFFLAVEDPQDVTNDLAKGSYAIQKVRNAFDFAYQQLSAPAAPGEAILQRIIRLDAVLTDRQVADPRTPSPDPESSRLAMAPDSARAQRGRWGDESASDVSIGQPGMGDDRSAEPDGSARSRDVSVRRHEGSAADERQREGLPESRSPEQGEHRHHKHKSHKSRSQKRAQKRDRVPSRSPDARAAGWSDEGAQDKQRSSPERKRRKGRRQRRRERERDRAFTSQEDGEIAEPEHSAT